MKDARRTAYDTLLKTEKDGAYSNLALSSALGQLDDSRERALATSIVYGTLESKELLDMQLAALTGKPVGKMQTGVLVLMRMALYQIVFLDKIPDSAAVNEAVKLAKKLFPHASGFVNGVLRAFIRNGKKLVMPDRKKEPEAYLSAAYSCPLWLVRLWKKDYGEERCESILSACMGRPPVFVRVNTTLTDEKGLKEALEAEDVTVSDCACDNALSIEYTGAADGLETYKNGLFHVQDIASQLCCEILGAKENDVVYDVCAAPGGKTYTCAERMNGTGKVVSCDIYEQRVGLIESGAQRLKLDNVTARVRDACTVQENAEADRVLCDVPCSGLGIIRRKPDIKMKAKEEIDDLPALQRQILSASASLVKKGGVLVYSTCTLNRSENEDNVLWFLQNNSDFEPDTFTLPSWADGEVNGCCATLFPQKGGSDGFFISRMKRKE